MFQDFVTPLWMMVRYFASSQILQWPVDSLRCVEYCVWLSAHVASHRIIFVYYCAMILPCIDCIPSVFVAVEKVSCLNNEHVCVTSYVLNRLAITHVTNIIYTFVHLCKNCLLQKYWTKRDSFWLILIKNILFRLSFEYIFNNSYW